jgi:hypothetical protein
MKPEEQRALPVREPGIEIAALPRLDHTQQRTDCRLVASFLVHATGWRAAAIAAASVTRTSSSARPRVRRSADGVADQPGERRMDRHRGAGRPRD